MIENVQPVSLAALDLSQLLAQAVAQILEQSTELALLNIQVASGNLEGVGELLDILV